MPTFSIYSEPIGSQFVSDIRSNDPADKNDFVIYITADGNATLEQSDISVNNGGSVVSLEGKGCTYKATIRPPEAAAVLTVSIPQNAVPEGNPAVSKQIRVSTSFPDADAEVATLFLDTGIPHVRDIAVTSNRIYLLTHFGSRYNIIIRSLTFDGVEQTSEQTTILSRRTLFNAMEFLNGGFVFYASNGLYHYTSSDLKSLSVGTGGAGIATISKGILHGNRLYRWDGSSDEALTLNGFSGNFRGADGENIYSWQNSIWRVNENTEFERIGRYNFNPNVDGIGRGISVYRDTLYSAKGHSQNSGKIYTLDIRKYRPLSKNTKTTIHPVSASEGDRIPLTQFSPDAEKFIFDVGCRKPNYLSINADNELVIASNAVTETTPVFLRLRGINKIDSQGFAFYLIIRKNENPTVRDVSELTMGAGSSYDLFQIVSNVDSIAFQRERTQPADSSIADGVFSIATTGGTAYFTATNGNGSTHFQIEIDVVQDVNPDIYTENFRYRVEVEGIDVSADLRGFPSVSESLDPILINTYRANEKRRVTAKYRWQI